MNYFVAQVQTSKEEAFIARLHAILDYRLERQSFFFLKRMLKIRRAGKEVSETKPIFPGYVFIQTDSIDTELFETMRLTKYFLRFLPSNKNICSIQHGDLKILEHFIAMGPVADVSSVVFDYNDRIVVKSGPMYGLEGLIIKVDKRKKRAKVALDFSNKQFLIDLAFDILEDAKSEYK